jgi:hypothetical protein
LSFCLGWSSTEQLGLQACTTIPGQSRGFDNYVSTLVTSYRVSLPQDLCSVHSFLPLPIDLFTAATVLPFQRAGLTECCLFCWLLSLRNMHSRLLMSFHGFTVLVYLSAPGIWWCGSPQFICPHS